MGTAHWVRVLAGAACFSLLSAQAIYGQPVAPATAWPAAYYEDAELADVCFADKLSGWAVGERGAIWHTADGGQTWQQQASGVDCRLNSVCFLDDQHGWAVGGITQPLSDRSHGVVLSTSDGGAHWQRLPEQTLPGLHVIRLFPGGGGWLLGDPSPMYPSGVFATRDGGRTWEAKSGSSQGWHAGAFFSPRLGVIAGPAGQLAIAGEGRFEDTRTPPLGDRGLRDLVLTEELKGWLVGSGGLVLHSRDGGVSWQLPETQVPRGLSENFDWQAVAAQGDSVWIAGSPGTRILHSRDGGRSWQVQATGQNAPIQSIWFADELHGWAVGSLGVILATRDGGRTWERQHGGGRLALLVIVSEVEDIPLELIAAAAAEGYKSGALVLNHRDSALPPVQGTNQAHRLRQSILAAGGTSGLMDDRFPLPQAGLNPPPQTIVQGWDRAHDAQAFANLEHRLVREIRTWQPEIVVTHSPVAAGEASLEMLLTQRVMRALDQAAEPTALPELSTVAGLETWRPRRILGIATGVAEGDISVSGSQVIPHLGCAVSDLAARGEWLLDRDFTPPRDSLSFYLLEDRTHREGTPGHVFDGLELRPGTDARRSDSPAMAVDFGELTQRAQQRRNALRLVTLAEASPHGGAAWLAQLGDLTGGLPDQAAGEVLYEMAGELHASGQIEMGDEVLKVLVNQYPRHSHGQAAITTLVRHQASQEIAWRISRGVTGGPPPGSRAAQAVAIVKAAEQRDPTLLVEPLLQFSAAAAARRTSQPALGNRFYSVLASSEGEDWKLAAAGEMWLGNRDDLPPRPVWRCQRAAAPPRLDGSLADPLWRAATPIPLTSASADDQEWPAQAKLAYDADYLYLAVECHRAPGGHYAESNPESPRTHDADLTAHDRISLLLDTDRDYMTWWSLTADHRGWPAESIDGDTTWNPEWFIETKTAEGVWVLEAAIPLSELASTPPRAGEIWNVGVQRVVPGVGFQSWSRPAAIEPTGQGFGFLIFQ